MGGQNEQGLVLRHLGPGVSHAGALRSVWPVPVSSLLRVSPCSSPEGRRKRPPLKVVGRIKQDNPHRSPLFPESIL